MTQDQLRRDRPPLTIRVAPNTEAMNDDGHKRPSLFARAAMLCTPDRGHYIIGAIGIVGTVVAFGWTVLNWLALRGWL